MSHAPEPDLAFTPHDHGRCVASALQAVEAACARRGWRLTPVRRRTMEILLEAHAALGAYEVLERLAAEGLGSQPPVAYRALEFLVGHGFAHRIERLNAFVACQCRDGDAEAAHDPAFMICRACHKVAETMAPSAPIDKAVATTGFAVESRVVEIQGLCPGCQAAASGKDGS